MLYEWLNRSHVEWWGGEEARPTLTDVQNSTSSKRFSGVRHLSIAMLNEPIGYAQSYVALEAGTGWWEEETDPGARGIDQSLANASQLGKGLGTKLVRALVELLFNDPEVTKIQTDLSPSNLRAIRCYEKAGLRGKVPQLPQMVQPCTWFKHARHSSEHAVLPNPFHRGGRPRAGASGRPSCQTLNIMRKW